MYTKYFIRDDEWWIVDPYGVSVCIVLGEHSAEALLSHLNRNS